MNDQVLRDLLKREYRDVPGGPISAPMHLASQARTRALLRRTSTIALAGTVLLVGLGSAIIFGGSTKNASQYAGQVGKLKAVDVQSAPYSHLSASTASVSLAPVTGAVSPDEPVAVVYQPDAASDALPLVWTESPAPGCGMVSAVTYEERADKILIQLTTDHQPGRDCAQVGRAATVTLRLKAPWGNRPVFQNRE